MATAHQYSDYSSAGNDYYGSYYNQATIYDSSYYTNCISNANADHNNATIAINQNNNNHNGHYGGQSNWPTQTSYANNNNNSPQQQHQQQQQQQYYPSDTTQQYTNDQYHHQHQQQQYQSSRFSSTTSPATHHQLNVNQNYPEGPKLTEGYQTNAASTKTIENRPKENNSATLRALLSNKKLRYSAIASAKIDSVTLSPIKTDDSLDLFDDFAYAKRQPIVVGAIRMKHGYESESAQSSLGAMHSPTKMTSENLLSTQTHSPMTNYVEGISTPPLSPKEAAIERTYVTQMPTNMIDDIWTKNSTDCKYAHDVCNFVRRNGKMVDTYF